MTYPNDPNGPTDPQFKNQTSQQAGPTAVVPPGASPLNQDNFTANVMRAGPAINNVSTGIGLGSGQLTPPPLKNFVYSPEVRIVIGHGAQQVDISADVVRCTMMRAENSAATLLFTLHNKNLRYTPPDGPPPFARMDRVVCYMKKTGWAQVFSGYLDTVPYKQLYPGEVNFKATCTLKRLMHTWWNPAQINSAAILDSITQASTNPGDGQGGGDQGLASILRQLLVAVGGWNLTDIHIQNFPVAFYEFLKTQIKYWESVNNPKVMQFKTMLLGSDTSGGPGAYAGQNPNAGTPGPYVGVTGPIGGLTGTDVTTAFYITQIVAACDEKGLGPLVSDNTLGTSLTQSGTTGETGGNPFSNPTEQKAWQSVQQTGLNLQKSNRDSDAAILCTTAALVAGGGTQIRNAYNPSVPDSDTFPNDGPNFSGSGCGILNQQNTAQFGNLSQRMNPKQAAGMFMAALAAIGGWRNMDPGQACAQVQGASSPTLYTAAFQVASKLVQSYRTSGAQAGAALIPSAYGGPSGTSAGAAASAAGAAAAGSGAAPSMMQGAVTGLPSSTIASTSLSSTVNPALAAGSQPNSEGAINWCMQQALGRPYVYGSKGPLSYDCSGLVTAAFRAIGVQVGEGTGGIRTMVRQVPNASVQRGDIVEPSDHHVVIWCGDGTIIEAPDTGLNVRRIPNPYGPYTNWTWVGRACPNVGPNPAAPYNNPFTGGPGTPPAALTQTGGPLGGGSQGSSEGIARNLYSLLFTPAQFASSVAGMLQGEKAYMDGQPLIQMVSAVASAGLRNWCSGPDGSFLAYYPDYWGFDGKPAVAVLRDIEMQDVHIDFTDDALTTHVYVNGDYSMLGGGNEIMGWLDTAGVVSVEDTWLFKRLVQTAPAELEKIDGELLMRRFGIRPLMHTAAMAGTHELEFLMACQLFMLKWAQQYETQVSLTFMPELFPGMRVKLDKHNLEVYVSSVTHSCDYTRGFTTTATIMAPSSPYSKQLMLSVNSAEAPFAVPGQQTPSDALRAINDPFGSITGGLAGGFAALQGGG